MRKSTGRPRSIGKKSEFGLKFEQGFLESRKLNPPAPEKKNLPSTYWNKPITDEKADSKTQNVENWSFVGNPNAPGDHY